MSIKKRDNAIRKKRRPVESGRKKVRISKICNWKASTKNHKCERMCKHLIKKQKQRKKEAYWWNNKVSKKKEKCLR